MPDPRTVSWVAESSRRHAGARFRCRVCRRFVRATELGVCPSCGMPPPTFTSVTGRAPEQADPMLRRRLRWGALLLGVTVLAAVIYAALP